MLGRSDRIGAYPVSGRVVRPGDLWATVYRCLGINPDQEVADPTGRPLPLTRGEVIRELL